MRSWGLGVVVAFAVSLEFGGIALAQDYKPSSSDFGGIGLLQTRTARFADDGSFDVGVSQIFPYRRYLLNIQALPWIEGTFRYTAIENRGFFSGAGRGNETSFKDRGADIKVSLLREGRWRPALAVGLQDGLGTGQFSGEYVVTSKRFFDFDFSLGLGWGNPGSRGGVKNPLAFLSDTFKTRDTGGSAFGGTLNFGNWFHGEEVALFGGIEYQTPFSGISLKLEYDGNDYQSEPLGNVLSSSSPFNFGVNLRPYNWLDVSVGYERGRELMFRTTLRADFHTPGLPKIGQEPPPALVVRTTGTASKGFPIDQVLTTTVAAPATALMAMRRVPNLPSLIEREFSEIPETSLVDLRFVARSAFVQIRVSDPDVVRHLPFERAAYALYSQVSQLEFDQVVFDVAVGRNGVTQRYVVDSATLQRVDVVSYFFDELDRIGVTVAQVWFDDDKIGIEVEEPVGELQWDIGDLAFRVFPTRASNVEIAAKSDGSVLTLSRNSVHETVRAVPASLGTADRPITQHTETNARTTPALAAAVFKALQDQGVLGEELEIRGNRAVLSATSIRYRKQITAAGRAARILANNMPDAIEEFEIIMRAAGVDLFRVILNRSELERALTTLGSVDEIAATGAILPPAGLSNGESAYKNLDLYPSFSWSLGPALKQHIGGGDVFYAYALGLRAGAEVRFLRGLTFSGSVLHHLTDTFDSITVTSSATLPHVRSDIREYLQATDTVLARSQFDYLFALSSEVYGRVSAGIFEEMFGGYGGEVLFRPFGSRFAASVDVNWVRQRSFLQRFDFIDYSVVTGHLNVYYDLPYRDLLLQAHVGQYLAGDKGVTFQVSREFDSGVRAGVFLTLTDVPFAVFGEGSFDKGFFVSVPFDLFSTRPTRRAGSFGFRPLTKDGGQRLSQSRSLYDITAQGSLNEVLRDFDLILE